MASDIYQRGFADHGSGRDDLRQQEKGQGSSAANEMRPDKSHHRLAGYAKRKGNTRLRSDDPEAHLTDLPRNGGKIALGKVAGDDRPQNGIEAGFQLLRQWGDLLRHIVDTDNRGTDEQAQNGEVEATRSPFHAIGGGERQVAAREAPKPAEVGAPSIGYAIVASHGDDGGDERRDHGNDVGEDQAIARGVECEGEGANADSPGFYDGPGANCCPNVEAIGTGGERNVGPRDGDHDEREQAVKAIDAAVREHRLREGNQ